MFSKPTLTRIAIADDHTVMRDSLTELLTTLNYEVTISAENGKELIAKLEKAASLPDICILNVSMAIMDGYATAKELKRRWPAVKILAFTSNREKRIEKRMTRLGADAYLRKDTHPQILHAELQILYQSIVAEKEMKIS